MRSKLILLLVLGVCFCLFSQPKAYSSLLFDDGGLHVVNSDINDSVNIYDGPGPNPTIVNVVTNGSIADWLSVDDNSIVNITGGLIGTYLWSYGSSQVNLSDGAIGRNLIAQQNSDILITGGMIGGQLQALQNSSIFMSDGAIGGWLSAGDNGEIAVYGGVLNGDISVYDNGVINIYGSGFNYPLGSISDLSGILTGTLSNGNPLYVDFNINNNGVINIVPEPATLLLFGLGAFVLRKKRG